MISRTFHRTPHKERASHGNRRRLTTVGRLHGCVHASSGFHRRRCALLAHHDHGYPGLLAPSTREDSASQQLGLAVAACTWRVIALAEKEALSNRSLARLLHRVAFVNSTLVRVSLLAVAQWPGKFLPQPYKDSVDSLVKGWGQSCVTENGFNRCKDHQRDNKNLRMVRDARWHCLKDSKVFENVYKRKKIVAEPINFGVKGRPRLNSALYESQSGEPSVPDEMLYAVTGNASWLSPGPQSALHCVEGFDSPNWRVVNGAQLFLVVGLVVDRISTSTFHVVGSPRRTMRDATRLTEKRDGEAGREEGEARRRSGMATGRWHAAQGAASVESGAHSRSAKHDHRPPCHVSSLPHSTCAGPLEVDKSIWMSSYNSDELVDVGVSLSFIGS